MIDIDILSEVYFCFDEPVPYKVNNGEIKITPVRLQQSSLFLSSLPILMIDKNSFPDPKVIQMSYLQFICGLLEESPIRKQQLLNILILCLGLKYPEIKWTNGSASRPVIYDKILNIEITHKQFDDIKKIILYQNIVGYDDEYINPEFKKTMDMTNDLKNKGIVSPSLERKIAIISARTGITKQEQLNMTYRSHSLLFKEVCEEVEYSTYGAIAAFNEKPLDNWIYKKEKNKFEDYVTSVDKYQQSMGGKSMIKSSDTTNIGDEYIQQYENFNK